MSGSFVKIMRKLFSARIKSIMRRAADARRLCCTEQTPLALICTRSTWSFEDTTGQNCCLCPFTKLPDMACSGATGNNAAWYMVGDSITDSQSQSLVDRGCLQRSCELSTRSEDMVSARILHTVSGPVAT